ncbi:MAG: NAD(P)-dependent oxidoreductase [Sedimentisphaerales bacterium]
MKEHPLLVTAIDFNEFAHVRAILEKVFQIKYVEPSETALRLALVDADAYYASLHVRLTRELIKTSSCLKAVVTPSTGLDHIDLEAAEAKQIAVLSLKDDRKLLDQITATAELAWALVLACARHLPPAVDSARKGVWARDSFRGHQIAYKTLGILGLGRLGSMVADYGKAFRMRVIAHDKMSISRPGVEMVSFEELLRQSDILSVHIHLTKENTHILNAKTLPLLKPEAILINTSRGAVIDELALLDMLLSKHISAVGLDVIDGEWDTELCNHKLIRYMQKHDNLIITPHIGGVTVESQEMAFCAAAEKLVKFFCN